MLEAPTRNNATLTEAVTSPVSYPTAFAAVREEQKAKNCDAISTLKLAREQAFAQRSKRAGLMGHRKLVGTA